MDILANGYLYVNIKQMERVHTHTHGAIITDVGNVNFNALAICGKKFHLRRKF